MTLLADGPAVAPPGPRSPEAAPRTSTGASAAVGGDAVLAERAGWSVAALIALFGAITAWPASIALPLAAVVTPLLVIVSLLALLGVWARPRVAIATQVAVLGVTSVAVVLRAVQEVLRWPGYGTDALAFNEHAARLLLGGTNPYSASMAPALDAYQVPPDFSTFRLDGSAVEALSYPAGSVLAYVPAAALVEVHAGTVTNVACWLLAGALVWRMLPRAVAWVGPALLGLSFYVDYVVGGVTDAVWLPLALLAVHRWDRFVDATERRAVRWVAPLALGLALSVKQTPWFLAPFLLLGVALEARAAGRSPLRALLSYGAVVGGVFAAVNLPFLVADPRAWLEGSLLPLVESTVPDGHGLVSLAVHAGLGGGRLDLFGLAGAAFVLGALAVFVLRYPALKRAWVLLVPLAFALPSRSLGSYLVMLAPVALVAATTVRPLVLHPAPSLLRPVRWVAAAGLGGAALAAAAALAVPSPLHIEVTGVRSTGAWQTVAEVEVTVRNRADEALAPAFTVNDNGRTTTFWSASDTSPLAPGETRALRLRARDTASMPTLASSFEVLAFTSQPGTVSSSPPYSAGAAAVSLSPMAVPDEVPVGQDVVLTAQLRDRSGAPLRRQGVRVSLGQVVYAQEALLPANTSIDGRPQGQSPVTSTTDGEGVVRFRVRGLQPQRDPVYYQAWVEDVEGAPVGFSDSVLVRYTGAAGD